MKNTKKTDAMCVVTFNKIKMVHILAEVITHDEIWVYEYDLERKQQSSQRKPQLPHPR
jgi:hypothetical protein